MKRSLTFPLVSLLALPLAACGGDDPPIDPARCDVEGGEACFVAPTKGLTVYVEGVPQPANLSCGAPTIQTSTMAITVSGRVDDFQTGNAVPNAHVDVWTSITDFAGTAPVATTQAGSDGMYSIEVPSGAPSRLQWRTRHPEALDTYGLNARINVDNATVTQNRGSVSITTANALPAFIGVTRTEGLGVLAGTAADCDGRDLEHAVATVSTTSGTPTFVEGAQMYYFSAGGTTLPVKRNRQEATNTNGLFVAIEIPPTSGSQRYFLQVWGFKSDADVTEDPNDMVLISEFESPVVGDSVISITMDPTEGPL
jgi:hypothetical protein